MCAAGRVKLVWWRIGLVLGSTDHPVIGLSDRQIPEAGRAKRVGTAMGTKFEHRPLAGNGTIIPAELCVRPDCRGVAPPMISRCGLVGLPPRRRHNHRRPLSTGVSHATRTPEQRELTVPRAWHGACGLLSNHSSRYRQIFPVAHPGRFVCLEARRFIMSMPIA